jgi:putative N6-adenine-specific DNA methylase
MGSEHLFVSCTPGLEGALGEELESLGYDGELTRGGASLVAPPGSYRRLNLWSRIASRVLLRIGEVTSPRELAALDVSAFGAHFEVDAFGPDALAWSRALVSTPGATRLQLRVGRGRCEVSVDTTGEPLHLRGYRQEVGRAPMRETLAAGLLRLARWHPGEPLWDVMCGSGTIIIEAAELAAGLAPGRNRRFAFESLPCHDEAAWRALPRVETATPSRIRGSDVNAGALGTARRNARRAGVLERLALERLDATKLPRADGPTGLVMANLPYGKRVGERDELATLYAALGRALKAACPGWAFCFLLQAGAERLGLPLEARHAVSNGGLPCEVVLGHVPG